jgi:hypothetical protein
MNNNRLFRTFHIENYKTSKLFSKINEFIIFNIKDKQ